ncbi:hypothetical protein GCM10020331_002340 [Ectobacillus funiculus]
MGTAALTTRGMKQEEMVQIAKVIASVLKSKGDKEVLKQAKRNNKKLFVICIHYFKQQLLCKKGA